MRLTSTETFKPKMRVRRSLAETGSKKQRKLHIDTSEKLQQKASGTESISAIINYSSKYVEYLFYCVLFF